MNIQDFLACMRLLSAYYIDWQFNFDDKYQFATWYQFLQSSMDFNTLKRVIHVYMARNNTGPNSPGELQKLKIELDIKDMINNGEEENEQ